ncbi:hypothetical protein IW261DRAFT_1597270 [Armillaria novae-zelandiae]|uniref:Uncharacterized protein n=1 Tax=Armillaria novae-zelandiae TaxID=153914 RepID=A0AA39NTA5_9AGAR|nr:hypothetical protein IW261DRAFT_1597270 [Armillaria novae-zelandiae]
MVTMPMVPTRATENYSRLCSNYKISRCNDVDVLKLHIFVACPVLSPVTAFLAILIDGWYFHYLLPMAGQPTFWAYCLGRAKTFFHSHWGAIREERDRMLTDCMELSRDGPTRWVPRDIPDIDRRIEPLLRLEILFPDLCRMYPSRLFGEHDLDFSSKLSNTLSITLSAIDDAHILKPGEQNQVLIDAFAANTVHHPLIWDNLLYRHVDKERLMHKVEDGLTIEECINLVTDIYSPKDKTLTCLLAFFPTSEPLNVAVDLEQRSLLAIIRTLVPDLAPSTSNSHRPHPFYHDSTISKYQLLCIALSAIRKDILSADPLSKEWQTLLFWATLSDIKSDLYSRHTLSDPEYSEFKDPFWTCRAYALVCMGLFTGGHAEYCVAEWKAEWADKPFFLNILRVIDDERVADAPFLLPVQVKPDSLHPADSIFGVVSRLLGQAFEWEIPGAHEAFREKDSLRYIAERRSLHPDLIEGLRGYITGLSNAKAGKFPDIQSGEFPDCGTQPRPILSSLASLDPNHSEWDRILHTLYSPNDENSHIEETVKFLDECFQVERGSHRRVPTFTASPQKLKMDTDG